jgi:hypothetical protein
MARKGMGQSTRVSILKRDGKEASVTLDVSSPKMKKHPVTPPEAVVFRKLDDGIGLLCVTMFPGIVGVDFAREIDRAIRESKFRPADCGHAGKYRWPQLRGYPGSLL